MTLLTPTPPDTLNGLLQDLGPRCADVAAVVQDGASAWTVRFRDDSLVRLGWMDKPPRLELLAPVIRLAPLVDREVLEGLLMFNLLSADSGGARMALSASDRSLHLMRDLPPESLHLDGLRDALRALAGLAAHWREALVAKDACHTPLSPIPSSHQESAP